MYKRSKIPSIWHSLPLHIKQHYRKNVYLITHKKSVIDINARVLGKIYSKSIDTFKKTPINNFSLAVWQEREVGVNKENH